MNEDRTEDGTEDGAGDAPLRIVRNRARCLRCGGVAESTHVHHLDFCSCGAVGVDGGTAYLRRLGRREDREDLAELEPDPDAAPGEGN